MSYTIPQIPATATSIGTSDLFEISNSGTSKQIAWSSILNTVQTWAAQQTFVAPVLGAATATSINKVTLTAPATGATLTIADGKTLTVSNNATISGTNTGDAGTVTSITPTNSTLTFSVNPIVTTGSIGLNLNSANIWTQPIDINLNTASLPTPLTGSIMQLAQVDGTAARFELNAFGAQAFFTGVGWGGTKAAPTALTAGTQITGFNSYGYNGTSIVGPVSTFRTFASETWSNTGPKQGSYAEIAVTATGGSTLVASMRFENDGGITLPSTVTGGSKGLGTINVTGGFYVNGTLLASGTGTVTNVATDASINGGPITTTGTLGINLSNPNTWTGLQTHKISDSATSTVSNALVLTHDTSGTPAASFGTGLLFQGQDTTTADVNMAAINATYLVATHASRSTQIQFQTVSNAGALSTSLTVGSGISGATAALIVGGKDSANGSIWSSAVVPAVGNYALRAASNSTALNCPAGGSILFNIADAVTPLTLTSVLVSFVVASTSTNTFTSTAANSGAFAASTIGGGLAIKTGTNARIGTGTLTGGTLTVANTSVTANSRVFAQDTASGALTNVGTLQVVTSAGVGFTVTSSNVLDTSTFIWVIFESIP